MASTVGIAGLVIDAELHEFLTAEVLPGIDVSSDDFYAGLADAVRTLGPRNRELLDTRQRLQGLIDAWHLENAHGATPQTYRAMLEEIGYLVPPGEAFAITTSDVDPEISDISGPQLIVPITNARYALNAVNARWGSLYDALYGTDALGTAPAASEYDPERGARVIAWVRAFLDDAIPLADGSHARCTRYSVCAGKLEAFLDDGRRTRLREDGGFVGHIGSEDDPSSVFVRNHGLAIEIKIDREDPIGASDTAGVADVILEAAVTVIVDFEDSVAAVDAADKVAAYRNWLGLMNATLEASVDKDGMSFVRRVNADRFCIGPTGEYQRLRTRALLMARSVGHLMTTTAVRDQTGQPVFEGILDTFVLAAIALHDRNLPADERNSRHDSIYIVKPKMHGPDEVAFACELFAAAEHTLRLAPDTLKMGIMDEERRTTLNLQKCVREAASRVVFINTGFLDRTGDEIHTSMHAGAMVRKADMRTTTWIQAYEDWNVDTGLRCGFTGRAQIGKGMWAMPDLMHQMLEQKVDHPLAGASCAWVPSPTAATLHATHYHRVDVAARQRELLNDQPRAKLHDLLKIPVAATANWSHDDRLREIENNLQGILGYVVRWVDQGVGCSKVPDIANVALMEDRATCRISSQHIANWMLHNVVTQDEVEQTLRLMASVVDAQNAGDANYEPMGPTFDGPAFRAARDLVFEGMESPSGYTEPILHARRLEWKHNREGVDG